MSEESIEVKEATWKAQVLAKIESLHSFVGDLAKSLDDGNKAMWGKIDIHRDKIQDHDIRFTGIDIQLSIMTKIMWVIVACSLTTVLAALWKLVLR